MNPARSMVCMDEIADGTAPAIDLSNGARMLTIHWRLYVDEGVELAIFMISACCFTVWLFNPAYPVAQLISDNALRRLIMGLAMGTTAILIIHSPMGKRSGAHFNPAITLTYLRLGKIGNWDAFYYVVFQFLGGIAGVESSAMFLGPAIADPSVNYAVTVPGRYGTAAAFFAEMFMAALLMGVVLWFSNRPAMAKYTSYLVGILIVFYIFLFAPVSGFSINPARTAASAVFAHLWTAFWLYCVAPIGGMMVSAELYIYLAGSDKILCAKLHPDPAYPCPFHCTFPRHFHLNQGASHGPDSLSALP